jgi:head-tail adaptor
MPIPRSLIRARTVVARTFAAEATVLRKTSVRDDSGGFVDTYTESATYPCSFRRTVVTPREFERDVRTQSIVFWSFSFAVGTDIRNTDRLLVGARTFEVVAAGENSIPIVLDVTAIEVV